MVLPSPRTPPGPGAQRPAARRGAAAGPRVAVVLVACDGQRWLPETLAALAAQTRTPDEVVVVDAGSRDASAQLLAGSGHPLLRVRRSAGFLDAVRAALALSAATALSARAAAAGADPSGGAEAEPEPGTAWLWLLHDDSAPAPDALERLLAAVEVAPSASSTPA